MSKSRKLLSCLLCAVLLVSALCVAVFAEDEPGRVTYPSVNTDFEKWSYEFNANAGDTTNAVKGIQVAMDKTYGRISSATYKDENGENTYFKFWNEKDTVYEGTDASTGNPWLGINGGGYGTNNTWRLLNYDYVTVDYEFCSDTYMDPDTKEFLSEYKEGAVLAYPENAFFDVYTRAQPNPGSTYYAKKNNPGSVNFKLEDGKWYLVSGSNKLELAQEAGMWNHLTFIIAVDRTPIYTGQVQSGWKFSDTDMYIYLDGNLVNKFENCVLADVNDGATVEQGGTISSLFSYEQIRVNIPSSIRKAQAFSLCLDNIQTNYYEAGYTGGIDKILADSDKNLAEAEDTVISGLYQKPYPSEPVAMLDEVPFYFAEATHHFIKKDSVLEIFKSFDTPYYVDAPFIVKSNGNGFEYTTDAYELQKVGNDYYFVNTTDPIRVIFDGDPNTNYRGALYNDSVTLAANSIPKYPLQIPYELEYVYHADDEKTWHFIGWSTEKGSETLLDSLPTITQEDVYYGCYYLYPVYEKLEPAYFVETSDGDSTVKIGYHSYDSLADNLNTDGARIIFNGSYTSTDILSIENNITIELNGNTIYYYSDTKIADVADGVYTFRDAKDEEKLTVKWFSVGDDKFENPIGTQTQIPGNTFNYTVFNKQIVNRAYSAELEKIAEYTGWSTAKNNQGEALSGELYTISLDTEALNFYPMYTTHDCAFYVEYNGVKTGYLTYAKVEDYTTLDGATVHFVTPYSDFLYIEDSVTLVPYDNTFVYYSETQIADIIDGNYVFRDVTPNDYVDVSWVDLNGVVQKTERHIPGNTINTPKINVKVEGNVSAEHSTSFYKTYLAWEEEYTIQRVTPGADNPNVFKPTNTDPGAVLIEADIKNIKYSFSVVSDFSLNLYVPDPEIDRIVLLPDEQTKLTIGGKAYIELHNLVTVSPTETGVVKASFEFTVDGVRSSHEVEVSIPEYFESVLAKADSTKEEKELVVAAANYCNALYKMENGTDFAPYKAIVDNNAEFFASLDEIIATNANSASNGLTNRFVSTYVTGMRVYYDAETNNIGYAFIVKSQYTTGGVTYVPASRPATGGLAEGTYGLMVTINGKQYGTNLVTETDGDGNEVTMLVLDMNGDSVPTYVQGASISFTLYRVPTGGNETIITGTSGRLYSPAIYLNSVGEGEDVSMLRTIYAFSYAAQQYNAAMEKADDDTVITDAK